MPAGACGARVCSADDSDRIGEWRYAVVAGLFDPVENLTADELAVAWRAGRLAASGETRAVLAPRLGEPAIGAGEWTIVPAHELTPNRKTIAINSAHPLLANAGPLVVPLCGVGEPVRNIDPSRVTTLVMTGTTALTREIADRIAQRGIAYIVQRVKPWFAAADLVHISHEVSFVRDCDPKTGPNELDYCARETDIALLDAVNTKIVELTGSHLHDYGRHWIDHTIDMYAKRGWTWFGGGRTQLEATTPRLVEHGENKLAFLGCNWIGTRTSSLTTGAGVAGCNWARMVWQIHDLRRRGYVPIVSIQHEEVQKHEPSEGLVVDLRRIAEAGAAFVLGSQAHIAHPWEVHFGSFIHYGPGNLFFQMGGPGSRIAVSDKLYIHAGRLLSVERLFTKIEHGRPQPLTLRERTKLLRRLEIAAATLPSPQPNATPELPAEGRVRPDSFVVRGGQQRLLITVPDGYDAAKPYPLIVALAGDATADDSFVVVPIGKRRATPGEIIRFIRTSYAIVPAKATVLGKPPG